MTVTAAAAKLNVTTRTIQRAIAAGQLPAQLHGPVYWIEPRDLRRLKRRPRGRPSTK